MQSSTGQSCDIVIPVWNHLDMTKQCIDSIKKHTRFSYRMIIIDNASDEPTKNYLNSLQDTDGEKTIVIRNEENKGFVGAVNQGMKYSDAAYVCILNNDTIVTDGWLKEMVDVTLKNKDIGIINPSSNTLCQFPGKLGIDEFAKTLSVFKNTYQELYRCRGFSMVVKREVIGKIGYLNEAYGMGYFDDTDYSKRAQAQGFLTVRAKASYVYHKESQSFSRIDKKNEIFLENENKFVSKWGRQLRVSYVIPTPVTPPETAKVSSNINKIAKMGHQVWIFTVRKNKPKLNLIDHENIRFFCYPAIFFTKVALYKIQKRKKKKKLHIVLTNNERSYKKFDSCKNTLNAGIFKDNDFAFIERKLEEISHSSFYLQ